MAAVYRAYYALHKNPRINSKGLNTSCVLGFTTTLYDLLRSQRPTHVGVAFDLQQPTFRHEMYAEYKANREAMPEEIQMGLPWVKRIIGDFLFGAAFLFLGLGTLKETGFNLVRVPETAEAISAFFANFNEPNFWNSFFFLIMGTVLTLCVQSSAAIMAITMILCSTGILHIDQGIMLVLGENIGTTITANIVASTANTSARRAAFAHLAINVLGVTWALILLRPFINLVCGLVGFDRAIDISHPMYADNLQKASIVLAAFHSMFNITNTLLLIWFVPQIERFVC